VSKETKFGEPLEFSGLIFQPQPWTATQKRGMPVEYEQYKDDVDNYVFINVPPTLLFKCKIFKPSRLCAIYKRK